MTGNKYLALNGHLCQHQFKHITFIIKEDKSIGNMFT